MKKLKMCWSALYPYGSSEVLPHGNHLGASCGNSTHDQCDHARPHACSDRRKGWDECTCEEIDQSCKYEL